MASQSLKGSFSTMAIVSLGVASRTFQREAGYVQTNQHQVEKRCSIMPNMLA